MEYGIYDYDIPTECSSHEGEDMILYIIVDYSKRYTTVCFTVINSFGLYQADLYNLVQLHLYFYHIYMIRPLHGASCSPVLYHQYVLEHVAWTATNKSTGH